MGWGSICLNRQGGDEGGNDANSEESGGRKLGRAGFGRNRCGINRVIVMPETKADRALWIVKELKPLAGGSGDEGSIGDDWVAIAGSR